MNKVCKVIWSHVLQGMVVVSEVVTSRGKTRSVRRAELTRARGVAALRLDGMAVRAGGLKVNALAGALALAFGPLGAGHGQAQGVLHSLAHNALPAGGSVAAGRATISSSGANMVIDQATSRAVVNWHSFNVGQGAAVHFNNAGGSTLNRA